MGLIEGGEPELAGQEQLDVCGEGTASSQQGLPRSPRNAQDSAVPDIKEGEVASGLKKKGAGGKSVWESQCGS